MAGWRAAASKFMENPSVEKGLLKLGGIGPRGAAASKIAGLPADTLGPLSPGGARSQLLGMGKRRAMYGGAGLGAVGIASGTSGMRARASGGYTGSNVY